MGNTLIDEMTIVYISASFPRIEEARKLRAICQSKGWRVLSGWLDQKQNGYKHPETLPEMARRDSNEMKSANLLVQLTGDTLSKGGRHAELGIAVARRIPVHLIGPRESVFHHLPEILVFESIDKWQSQLNL